MTEAMTYRGSGVDYDSLDYFKRAAQAAALDTDEYLRRATGGTYQVFGDSRGESVFLIETPNSFLAHVEEGLGTKNLVADGLHDLVGGQTFYDHIAQCTVAMIVNDMITMGALPLAVAMHLAVGSSEWFNDERRAQDLIDGWKRACDMANCAWAGGETPALVDIIHPDRAAISGSAIGEVYPKAALITDQIQDGDSIIIVESSGVHANGLTLTRRLAERLKGSYLATLPDGKTYGETLLDPTRIYVPVIAACFNASIDVHYAVNITGHGWRKLMRSESSFSYVIDRLPRQQQIFDFIQEHGNVDDHEAYGNFNMGAGFALYVSSRDVDRTIAAIGKIPGNFRAFEAGKIHRAPEKQVCIEPKNIVFVADELQVR